MSRAIEALGADKAIRLITDSLSSTKLPPRLPRPPLAPPDRLNGCPPPPALSEVTSSVPSPLCKRCSAVLRLLSAKVFMYCTCFRLFNLWPLPSLWSLQGCCRRCVMGVGRQGQSARLHARLSLGTFNWTTVFVPVYQLWVRITLLRDATVGGDVPPSARCHQTVFWLTFYVTNRICQAM